MITDAYKMQGADSAGPPRPAARSVCSVNPSCFAQTGAGSRGARGILKSLGLGAGLLWGVKSCLCHFPAV